MQCVTNNSSFFASIFSIHNHSLKSKSEFFFFQIHSRIQFATDTEYMCIVESFERIRNERPDVSLAVAAVKALTESFREDNSLTTTEFLSNIEANAGMPLLKQAL
jgi:hypothetical protein